MALTKVNYYLSIAMIILIAFTSLVFFGNEINTKYDLDEDSEEYVKNIGVIAKDSGIESTTNSTADADTTNPFKSKLVSLPVIGEILGVVALLIDVLQQIWDFIVIVYNLPSIVVQTFGADLGAWQHIINLVAYTLLIGAIITFSKLIK